jgi:NAD(P)-dependent dehydrogenase (short-subunit alcohol dehydrogenase family)
MKTDRIVVIEQQVKLRAIPRDETGEDPIGAIFFLPSLDAEFISGQTINVDGGKQML